MPPELAVLVISTQESLASDLKALIAKNFRSRIASTTDPSRINQKIYAIDPDILVLDKDSLDTVSQTPRQFRIGDTPFYEGRFLVAIGAKPDSIEMDESRYVQLPTDAGSQQYLNAIEQAAETMGYMTAHGNVEDRLVQRELSVSIDVDEAELVGRTTGLDLEGCGVRVKSLDAFVEEGTVCRVTLDEEDLQGFVPARGVIKRIDDSWEDGYDAYLQIDFTGEGFPSNELAREVIQDLIDRQEDESISYQRDD